MQSVYPKFLDPHVQQAYTVVGRSTKGNVAKDRMDQTNLYSCVSSNIYATLATSFPKFLFSLNFQNKYFTNCAVAWYNLMSRTFASSRIYI